MLHQQCWYFPIEHCGTFQLCGCWGETWQNHQQEGLQEAGWQLFQKLHQASSFSGEEEEKHRIEVPLKWCVNGHLRTAAVSPCRRHRQDTRRIFGKDVQNVEKYIMCDLWCSAFPLNKSHSQMAWKILNYCLCLQFQLESVYKQNYFSKFLCSTVECLFLLLNKSLEQH